MNTPDVLDADDTESTPTESAPVESTASDVFTEDDDDDFQPTGDGEGAEASVDVAPVAETPAAEPEPEPVDFAIDVNGAPYAIPGLKFNAASRTLVAADDRAFQRLQTLARHGRAFETQHRPALERYEKQLAAKDVEVQQASARSDEIVAQFSQWMTGDINQVVDELVKSRELWPQKQLDVREQRLRMLEQQLNAPKAPDVSAPVVEDVMAWASTLALQTLEGAASNGMPWVTEDVRKELGALGLTDAEELWTQKVVRYATPGDVAQNPKLSVGQFMFDGPRFQHVLQRYEKPYTRAQQVQRDAAKQLQTLGSVAATNAKVLAKGTPPSAPKKPAPPSTSKPAAPPPREDAFAYVLQEARNLGMKV